MKSILRRLKQFVYLIKDRQNLLFGASYYPEYDRKSSFKVLIEQLFFILKYGRYEPFYFTYGFDRKHMTLDKICSTYIIPYQNFQKKVDKLNTINPTYGKYHGRTITADKFYFSIFLEKFNIPTPKVYCYIRKKRIIYLSSDFNVDNTLDDRIQLISLLSNNMDAFAKPADGQLGNGVFSLRVVDGKIYKDGQLITVDDIIDILFSADYLIQKRVVQHPKMSALCTTTLNSIRLQTVIDPDSGKVIPFAAGLRMGREGSYVDNWAKGGIFVGIDMKTGKLFDRGFIKPMYGTSVKSHIDSGIVFKDYEIPYFHEAVQLAKTLHTAMYRCHSVGWDIAITEQGPIFIEGNGLWEISLLQAAHGGLKHIEKYFEK